MFNSLHEKKDFSLWLLSAVCRDKISLAIKPILVAYLYANTDSRSVKQI